MILQVLITYNRFLSHHIVPYDESCRSTPVMPEFKAPAVEGPRSVWSRCGASTSTTWHVKNLVKPTSTGNWRTGGFLKHQQYRKGGSKEHLPGNSTLSALFGMLICGPNSKVKWPRALFGDLFGHGLNYLVGCWFAGEIIRNKSGQQLSNEETLVAPGI